MMITINRFIQRKTSPKGLFSTRTHSHTQAPAHTSALTMHKLQQEITHTQVHTIHKLQQEIAPVSYTHLRAHETA